MRRYVQIELEVEPADDDEDLETAAQALLEIIRESDIGSQVTVVGVTKVEDE